MATPISKTYRNAMEPLVVQEVQRQMQQLAPSAMRSINADDVIAYALNSLPCLYATTEGGWTWQQSRAQKELAGQIAAAVCQGLMVVHQAPGRSEDRLCSPDSNLFDAQKSLQEISKIPGLSQLNLGQFTARNQACLGTGRPTSAQPLSSAQPEAILCC